MENNKNLTGKFNQNQVIKNFTSKVPIFYFVIIIFKMLFLSI